MNTFCILGSFPREELKVIKVFENVSREILCKVLGGIVWKVGSGDMSNYATDHSISKEKVKGHVREYLNGNSPEMKEGKDIVETFNKKVDYYVKEYSPITREIIEKVMKKRLNQEKKV